LNSPRSIVIFDLGGVLIDWDPRHLYRRLFDGDTAAMEGFLTDVCNPDWNRQQDAGRSFAEAEAEAVARHPDKRPYIKAWFSNFHEMIPGSITGTVDILDELRQRKVPLYALTNWSHETFALQPARFDFLSWFDGIVVSGQEKLIKPDPGIFRVLTCRYRIDPVQAVFIDDAPANVAAATALGFHGIHFIDPVALRRDLEKISLLPSSAEGASSTSAPA
jgi:2-haloacid dehalogenase